MTPENFVFWLQGYAELNAEPPSAEQWQSIRDHLATVFTKVTPPMRFTEPQVPYRDPLLWAPSSGPLRSECLVVTSQRAETTC